MRERGRRQHRLRVRTPLPTPRLERSVFSLLGSQLEDSATNRYAVLPEPRESLRTKPERTESWEYQVEVSERVQHDVLAVRSSDDI